MPNEIYHRSEWGNPKAEGFGDVYFDPAATNKLYNHSDNYENSDGTDKILRDIPNKASIVLTPTAYSDGSLNTVIPTDGNGDFDFSRGSSATRVNEKGLIEDVQILSSNLVQNGDFEEIGSELVTNGDFENWTADNPDSWTVINEDANNYVTQDGTYARIVSNDTASIQIKQTIFTIGKTYKVELDAVVNSGNEEGLKLNDATAAATIGYVNSTGHHTFYFKAAGTSFVINRKGGGDTDISIDNVSVKEVGQNWSFGTGWSMGDGVATCDGSGFGAMTSNSSNFNNRKLKVKFDVSVSRHQSDRCVFIVGELEISRIIYSVRVPRRVLTNHTVNHYSYVDNSRVYRLECSKYVSVNIVNIVTRYIYINL